MSWINWISCKYKLW